MLLIQDEPHLIILASKTNQNLHLGEMIRNEDYGKKTFNSYMQINVNQKLVPITNGDSIKAPVPATNMLVYKTRIILTHVSTTTITSFIAWEKPCRHSRHEQDIT